MVIPATKPRRNMITGAERTVNHIFILSFYNEALIVFFKIRERRSDRGFVLSLHVMIGKSKFVRR